MSRSLWLYVLLWTAVVVGLGIVAAGVLIALDGGWRTLQGSVYAVTGAVFVTVAVIEIKSERKSNGRYRKASEAHRAGAGGSAGDGSGAGARGGALGAGASMNPFPPGSSSHAVYEAIRQQRGGIIPLPSHLQPSMPSNLVSVPPLHTHVAQPASRSAGDFDGKEAEFAAGVVTGTRSFDVDKLGRLLGVTYRAVWLPGENEAKCMERVEPAYWTYGRPDEARVREAHRPAHSIVDCGHGFYGYYEGSNDFYEAGRVMGVVEAYGETIIGSRGFRASKARIIALHIPEDVAIGKRRLIARNYPEIPIFDSFDAMVAECPPDDAGNGVGPETDPDFWTRGVSS